MRKTQKALMILPSIKQRCEYFGRMERVLLSMCARESSKKVEACGSESDRWLVESLQVSATPFIRNSRSMVLRRRTSRLLCVPSLLLEQT